MRLTPEQGVVFSGEHATLVGVLHPTPTPASCGVLILVGGPQYRAGSHRQFVLLARFLAAQGVPVLRFDYQGMGDSDGEALDFSNIGGDITAAITLACQRLNLQGVVIWGLCDAASAALLHSVDDPRVRGLVLLNPWVRTEQGLARAYVRHYYRQRLLSRHSWQALLRGRLNPWRVAKSLLEQLRKIRSRPTTEATLPRRMAEGLQRFTGPVLIILSGDDLTAQEFQQQTQSSSLWQALLADTRVSVQHLAAANHTFSRAIWRDQVARWTLDWFNTQVRA